MKRLFFSSPSHPQSLKDVPTALTIGNFDGVHVGHQAIIHRLVARAQEERLLPSVLTFEPHPRDFFAANFDDPVRLPRLTNLSQKAALLQTLGVAQLCCLRFNQTLADCTPEAFIEQILSQQLRARLILVGEDFRFGRQRLGDVALLRQYADTFGFTVETFPEVLVAGQRAASSKIRAALASGDLAEAALGLNRPYSMCGRVAHGAKRARGLGFPTANIPLRQVSPLSGVYAVLARGQRGEQWPGVANIGWRPTIAAGLAPLLEAHLFDFTGDLYGHRLQVEFHQKIRDEQKYSNLEALQAQIARDVTAARQFFSSLS